MEDIEKNVSGIKKPNLKGKSLVNLKIKKEKT
jgi:hypothetical protein